ncbi:MAG: carboxypeptidase-like regulatory domain-containing protein, partial [Bacteroidota bacterium]
MKSSLLNLLMFASKKTIHIFLVQVVAMHLLMANTSNSQSLKEVKIDIQVENASLEEVFQNIEDQTNFTFGYSKNVVNKNIRFTYDLQDETLESFLSKIGKVAQLNFKKVNSQLLVYRTSPKKGVKSKKIESGFLSGIVSDQGKNRLPFASISIDELGTGAISNENGKFNIRLPEGNYTVSASYMGYVTSRQNVQISSGQTTNIEFVMTEDTEQLNEVVVYGTLTRGQVKALNEQKNSANVKNVVSYEQFSKYPDRNAAEALQRIPGVAISRDQGEGELISIRGMSPRFNAVQVNGQRIPSPDPDTDRAVGLDLLQVDLMESIVVNKTLLPDMDGDAIGGTVNFRLKQAPEEPILNLAARGGFNQQQSDFDDYGRSLQAYSAVAGKRFLDNKLGIIATGSFYKTNRGSLLNQYTYVDNTTEIEEKRNNDYDVRRERYGLMISPDFRFNENHSLRIIANYNVFNDDEIRRRVDYLVGDGEEEREIRNRVEEQTHYIYQFIGDHHFKKFDLDYNVSLTQAKEEMPDRTYWRFARDVDYSSLSNQERFDLSVTDNPGGDNPLFLN